MSPFEHGEVFVLDDGGEVDLDLGNYERFLDIRLGRDNNLTTGKVYSGVIERERRGDYLGKTVQVVPHITDEIQEWTERVAAQSTDGSGEKPDVCVIELGGTVGDIESLPFLEAIRQFALDAGKENCLYIHLTLVPYLKAAAELKTKPTQHSVKRLLEIGIQPDIIVCRTDRALSDEIKRKISLFCNVRANHVITAQDVSSIYALPLALHQEGLDDRVVEALQIWCRKPDLSAWTDLIAQVEAPKEQIDIAIVGKYVELVESYKSLNEALKHGGLANGVDVNLHYIDAGRIEDGDREVLATLNAAHGVLVPGGFGKRGIQGKIDAIRNARESKRPFFGICLGMQCAVIEYSRHVLGLTDANSTEFDQESGSPVIDLMEAQRDIVDKGATMRLGAYPCRVAKDTKLYEAYGEELISERHRHRYEFNNAFRDRLREAGMVTSGLHEGLDLVETIELPAETHPWFVGVQFHPEYKSRPLNPHPLFTRFIGAAAEHKATR